MLGTRMFTNTLHMTAFKSITNPSRNFYSMSHIPVNDCVFMQSKIQSLVPNFYIHNIQEMLEKMCLSNEIGSLADLMEFSLINQSKISCRVILKQDGIQQRIGNQFRADTNWPSKKHLKSDHKLT